MSRNNIKKILEWRGETVTHTIRLKNNTEREAFLRVLTDCIIIGGVESTTKITS